MLEKSLIIKKELKYEWTRINRYTRINDMKDKDNKKTVKPNHGGKIYYSGNKYK